MRNYTLYEYFYFTRQERNASIVLSVIIAVSYLLPLTYPLLRPTKPVTDFEAFKAKIAPLLAQKQLALDDETGPHNLRGGNGAPASAELFHFDPNTASLEDLVRLGLSPKTAQTVLNYRNKGGQFKQSEDFKKLYTLRPEDYERLAPWISIAGENRPAPGNFSQEKPRTAELFRFDPNTASVQDFMRLGLTERTAKSIENYRTKGGHFYRTADFQKIYALQPADYERLAPFVEIAGEKPATTTATLAGPAPERKKWQPSPIDINQATVEEWQQLRGIGPGLSKRIVNFRDKLGGFVSIEQVAETSGLPDSTYQAVREYLQMGSAATATRKLNVNTATLEELKAHPYLSALQATILFNYKKQHGNFKDLAALKQLKSGFTAADWKKLEPYLSVE